jgi:hypothetical protein
VGGVGVVLPRRVQQQVPRRSEAVKRVREHGPASPFSPRTHAIRQRRSGKARVAGNCAMIGPRVLAAFACSEVKIVLHCTASAEQLCAQADTRPREHALSESKWKCQIVYCMNIYTYMYTTRVKSAACCARDNEQASYMA